MQDVFQREYNARAELRVFHDNGGVLVIMEGSSAQAICSRRLRRGQIVRALAQLAHSRRRRRREPLNVMILITDTW